MRLEINKCYSLFTTSDYITNKKVKVLGFVGYDRASQFNSFVENVAINEKFIDTVDDTEKYLRNKIYYDCGVIEYVDGEWELTGDHIIVWDDILDMDRTTRLYVNYTYKFDFAFKDLSSTDVIQKEDVIECVKNALETRFNTNKQRVGYEFTAINDASIDSVETQLEKTNEMLTKANETLGAFVSLQDSAKQITTDLIDNNILGKVNQVNSNVETILDNTYTILQNTQ